MDVIVILQITLYMNYKVQTLRSVSAFFNVQIAEKKPLIVLSPQINDDLGKGKFG